MADKHIADCESGFKVIAMGPDACKVGKPVIPFDSMQLLSSKKTYSPDVFARSMSVLHQGCIIQGSQSNAGKGILTGTSGGAGHCIVLSGSPSVNINKQPAARHESMCAINNGNAMAQLNTGSAPPNAAIVANKQPCNDPPQPSKKLDELKTLRDDIAKLPMNPSQLDKYVDFEGASKTMQGGIDSFRASDDSWAITKGAAGVSRGLAGFVKDFVMGTGGLAYAIGKRVVPVVGQIQQMQDQTDIAILQENIRLGNVCLEGVKQQAKAMGTSLAKPVTDAWERGDYAEAITRGGVELLTIVLPMAKAGWLGKTGEVANVGGKASEATAAAKAAQVTKATEAANALKASETAKAAETAASAKKAQEIAEAAKAGKPVETTTAINSKGKTVKTFITETANGVAIKAKSLRDLFLGRTPGKGSKTGREVIERMRNSDPATIRENPISGKTEFMDSQGNWRDLSQADMAHNKDAVSWWNETGRNYGARSPEVRDWMLKSDNYTLDYFGYNRSAGAGLSERYLPPLK
jgi:hypothetical protein